VNKFLSKIILPLITFLIRVIAGGSLFYIYGKDYLLVLTGLQPVKYIIWESEEANEPYRSGKRDVARYALEHNVKILEFYSKDKEVDCWGASADLALTYGRLAKLAAADGDKKRADALLKKAAETYTKRMKSGICTPEKILKNGRQTGRVGSGRENFSDLCLHIRKQTGTQNAVERSRPGVAFQPTAEPLA